MTFHILKNSFLIAKHIIMIEVSEKIEQKIACCIVTADNLMGQAIYHQQATSTLIPIKPKRVLSMSAATARCSSP